VTPAVRRTTARDLPRLRQLWREQWSGEEMIVHGEVFRPEQLEGFEADDWAGAVSYLIRNGECEIISLNSLQPNRGIGSALLEAVVQEARRQACRRVFLSTTNDNLDALGFYQRRGLEICAVRRRAVDETRKRKPSIPVVGENGIPLRDEIELEMPLSHV
jgi:GNAT superfamily N-acetyltransferase